MTTWRSTTLCRVYTAVRSQENGDGASWLLRPDSASKRVHRYGIRDEQIFPHIPPAQTYSPHGGRPGTSPPARETRCHHLRNAFRPRCIQAHGAVSDKLRLHDRQMEKSRIQVLSLILSENLSRHWTNDRKHRMCTKTRPLDGTARYSARNRNCAHHVTAILSPRRPWAMEAATPASTQLCTCILEQCIKDEDKDALAGSWFYCRPTNEFCQGRVAGLSGRSSRRQCSCQHCQVSTNTT